MKIRDDLASKYWLLAAEEEVASSLETEGYSVKRETLFGGIRADLVATRGKELRVYEFKTPSWSPERTEQAKRLRNHVVHELSGDFRLVWVAPPSEREIEIDDLEIALCGYLEEHFPNALDVLSDHTRVEEVSDAEVYSVHLQKGRTIVKGQAMTSVELGYGSESDQKRGDGLRAMDSFPFSFEVELDSELHIVDVVELQRYLCCPMKCRSKSSLATRWLRQEASPQSSRSMSPSRMQSNRCLTSRQACSTELRTQGFLHRNRPTTAALAAVDDAPAPRVTLRSQAPDPACAFGRASKPRGRAARSAASRHTHCDGEGAFLGSLPPIPHSN